MNNTFHDRRRFLQYAATSAGALALLTMQSSPVFGAMLHSNKQYTVQEIIDIILKAGNLPKFEHTLDTIKSGSADMVVTGIVTTMFATITVIEEAVKLNANFIIAHEPTFYNHTDNKDWVKDNTVEKQKEALLNKHKITVWRFHDYIHSFTPDGIYYGVVKKAGWLSYYKPKEDTLTIPTLTLQQLAAHLKSTLNIAHVRVVGDLKQPCSKIAMIPGAAGGVAQVSLIEKVRPDVLIIGELSEWETAEYIRDGQLLGIKTALIVLGHAQSEEPGMEYLVEWLQPKLPGVSITHIASGSPFTWV